MIYIKYYQCFQFNHSNLVVSKHKYPTLINGFHIQFEYLWMTCHNKFYKNISNWFIKRNRTHDGLLNKQQHSDLLSI